VEKLSDYVDQREKYLTEIASRIDKETKIISEDPSIIPAFKTKKIQEIRDKTAAEYIGRLEQNEKEFTQKIQNAATEVERLFDADIHLEKLGEHEVSRMSARSLYEQNLYSRLSYLPDAESFIEEYSRAVKDENEIALSVYERVRKGIAKKYGEDGHKVLRVIEEARNERIPAEAVERKELLADLARDFGRLNDSAKNGLAGLKARKGAKQAVKNRFYPG